VVTFVCEGTGSGEAAGNLAALAAAIPVAGVLGGAVAGAVTYRLARRGIPLLGVCAAAAVSAWALLLFLRRLYGFEEIRSAFEGVFPGGILILDRASLTAAGAVTAGAVGAFFLAVREREVLPRHFLAAFPWVWAVGLWAILFGEGVLRIWLLPLLSLLQLLAASPGFACQGRQVRLALAAVPAALGSLLWLGAAQAGVSPAWSSAGVGLLWLGALPLPGFMILWSEGAQAGTFLAAVTGGAVGLSLLARSASFEGADTVLLLSSLGAGVGAAVTNDVRRLCVFASLCLLAHGALAVPLGGKEASFAFLSFYPFALFGLYALVLSGGKQKSFDLRFRRPLTAPRWLKWLLSFFLVVIFGGLAPGSILAARLDTAARIQARSAAASLHSALFSVSTFLLVLGLLRFLRSVKGEKGVGASPGLLSAAGAFLLGIINPLGIAVSGIGPPPAAGLSFPYPVLLPVVGAVLLDLLAPSPEGAARLWSAVTPQVERRILFLTGPRPPVAFVGFAAWVVRFFEELTFRLLLFSGRLLRAVGLIARAADRKIGGPA